MGIQSRMITRVSDSCATIAPSGTDTSTVTITTSAATLLHARFTATSTGYLQYRVDIADALGNSLYTRSNIRNAELDLFESFALPVGANVITITNQADVGNLTVGIVVEHATF
jgi:hypothetical protein